MAKKNKKEFKQIPVGEDAADVAEYLRPRWKHYLRWMIFSFMLFLYFTLILNSYHQHILLHRGFLLQELFVYILCSLMMVPVLPSILFEVDYVKIDKESILCQNLLLRRIENWDNIVKFSDPMYLKFAILRSKSFPFFYLLNKRDIPNYEKLAETIREKAINLPK